MKKLRCGLIAFLCVINYSFGQITISESIKANDIATSDSNKLYFVDFWATWCAPCIHAKKYLGTLQKQFPNDFYIVSLSEQSPDIIKKYLLKNPTDLAIAIDYDNETFKKHNIQSLPNGILFDAKGNKLWQGHSADLSASDLKRFLNRTSAKSSVEEFIQLKAYKKVNTVEASLPEDDFVLVKSSKESSFLEVKDAGDFIAYEGSIKSILAYLFKVCDDQIQLASNIDNSNFKLSIKKGSRKQKKLTKFILRKLKLKFEESSKSDDVVVLKLNDPKFWNTDQINWGKNNPKYLIGDEQIQADNVSFEDIKYRLSNLLNTPFVIENGVDDVSLHDWQIHYKFYDLMVDDLENNFGISVDKKTMNVPIYIIKKGA